MLATNVSSTNARRSTEPSPLSIHFGERLALLLTEMDINEIEFTGAIGLRHDQLGRLLAGEQPLDLLLLERIASALSISVSQLLEGL